MKNSERQKTWFDVDRAGLEKIIRRKGIEFAVFELIQNAWDEAGVTRVDVKLNPDVEGGAWLTVEDDAPEGFSDLRHAYTLFAESAKKGNAEQRGRFNLGEKLVLSLCECATITTTKGTVTFNAAGRRETETKREHGTVFEALVHMSVKEQKQIAKEVKRLIPPNGIETFFNGELLVSRAPQKTIRAKLPTELSDDEGRLRRTDRVANINVYPLSNGEKAFIYEMGIPVVEHDCTYHCDIQQKVPLTMDRENVTPEFLRKLHPAVFNELFESLTTEDMNHGWAQTAIESKDVKPEAVRDYMTKRFGELRASFDMSDPEANNAAVANGYTIVKGGMLSGAAWKNVKAFETIQPAGHIFPTHPDAGIPFVQAEETDQTERVRTYAKALAQLLLGCDIDVQFCEQPSREAACWGSRQLTFNVRNLGKRWFDLDNNRLAIDDLIIHEFGHHYEANHLSEKYNDALSRLAAKAMALGRAGMLPA